MIAEAGITLAGLTPEVGLGLLVRLYAEVNSEAHFSCSWGAVNRYGPEEYGFAMTLYEGDQSAWDAPWVGLSFRYGPRSQVGDFPPWMLWCQAPDRLAEFREAIGRSAPFVAWGRSPARGVALQAGDLTDPHDGLFDRWGVRDPSRPVVSLTEEQWLGGEAAPLMLRWLRQEWRGEETDLDRLVQRYLLACCRRIWRLLPHEASRAGVEVAERLLAGGATSEEFGRAEWAAEGAALGLEQGSDTEALAGWCEKLTLLGSGELAALIQDPRPGDDLSPRGLLEAAAFFVDSAMCYPGLRLKESIERYRLFLSADLLREVVGNPFRLPAPLAADAKSDKARL